MPLSKLTDLETFPARPCASNRHSGPIRMSGPFETVGPLQLLEALLRKNAATCSCRLTKNILLLSDFHTSTPISSAYRQGASNSLKLAKSLNKKPGVALIRSRSSCQRRIWSTTVGGKTEGERPDVFGFDFAALCLRICGWAWVER